jgi:hypothetical protein
MEQVIETREEKDYHGLRNGCGRAMITACTSAATDLCVYLCILIFSFFLSPYRITA